MKQKRIQDRTLIDFVKTLPCIACGVMADDAHHVKTLKSGGGDVPENLMPLCRLHHRLIHDQGLYLVSQTYPTVEKWLKLAGWELYDKKWKRLVK